jgi:hypothetical protein
MTGYRGRFPGLQIKLTTTGRKSGHPHEVILYAWPDEDRLVVVGSYGGGPPTRIGPPTSATTREQR